MKTGLIIVNYNDYKSTKDLLDNIKDYKVIDKIVIVDNHSKDEEISLLKKIRNKKVKVLYLDENKGYSKAINEGSKYLISEFGKCNIIISNSDIIINSEKDIKELLKMMLDKEIGIVAPVILENKSLNRGWKLPRPVDEIIMNIPVIGKKYYKKKMLYKEENYTDDITEVDVVSGCFFLTKSDILKEINFLDENVFLYYEENILSKKLKSINKKVKINNNVIVIHNHSVTIDKNIKKINKYKLQKKSQYYFEKNYNNAKKYELFFLNLTVNITTILLIFKYRLEK